MGNGWIKHLRVDPIRALQVNSDQALNYFVRRDLLEEQLEPIESIWELDVPKKLFQKQVHVLILMGLWMSLIVI